MRWKKNRSEQRMASDTSIRTWQQKKEKIAREIAKELHGLRSLTQEIIDQVKIRVGAEIADLIRVFERETLAGEKHPLPPAKVEIQLLARIRALKTKPKKGRIKDLTRITGLLAEIRSVLDSPPAKVSSKKGYHEHTR